MHSTVVVSAQRAGTLSGVHLFSYDRSDQTAELVVMPPYQARHLATVLLQAAAAAE